MVKVLEYLLDTLLWSCFGMGVLFFLLMNWKEQYISDAVEWYGETFLEEAARDGILTKEEYEAVVSSLGKICSDYRIEVTLQCYRERPLYEADEDGTEQFTGRLLEEASFFSNEELRRGFLNGKSFFMAEGDILRVKLQKDGQVRARMQKIIQR